MKHPRYACCVPNHATIENDQKQLIQTPKGSDNSSKTKSIKSAGRKAASSAKGIFVTFAVKKFLRCRPSIRLETAQRGNDLRPKELDRAH